MPSAFPLSSFLSLCSILPDKMPPQTYNPVVSNTALTHHTVVLAHASTDLLSSVLQSVTMLCLPMDQIHFRFHVDHNHSVESFRLILLLLLMFIVYPRCLDLLGLSSSLLVSAMLFIPPCCASFLVIEHHLASSRSQPTASPLLSSRTQQAWW